jgi:N-acetylglucosamine malate deacetylase 2
MERKGVMRCNAIERQSICRNMKTLYIFPHPDDESFGPAPVMSWQRSRGHDVYLLTLTRGEATRQRFKYGYSKEEMGEVRYRELQDVAQLLNLTDLSVLDFPDGMLKELDPAVLEQAIENHLDRVRPDVVVSYPVHGVSGFHDHLVTHAVVKSAYCRMRAGGAAYLKRLAFYTLHEIPEGNPYNLQISTEDEIDCVTKVEATDVEKGREAVLCYKSYMEVIEKTNILAHVSDTDYFEFFQEQFRPPAGDLFRSEPDPPDLHLLSLAGDPSQDTHHQPPDAVPVLLREVHVQ